MTKSKYSFPQGSPGAQIDSFPPEGFISFIREPSGSGTEKNVHGILEEMHVPNIKHLNPSWEYTFPHESPSTPLGRHMLEKIMFLLRLISLPVCREASAMNVFRKANGDQKEYFLSEKESDPGITDENKNFFRNTMFPRPLLKHN